MAYIVMILGLGAWLLTAKYPALAVTLAELFMFLLGAAGLYVSGNAAVKWMSAKNGPQEESPPKPTVKKQQALMPDPETPSGR